jgi:hypothetical protein
LREQADEFESLMKEATTRTRIAAVVDLGTSSVLDPTTG